MITPTTLPMAMWSFRWRLGVLVLAGLSGLPGVAGAVTPAEVRARSQTIRMPFIENQGQADSRVAFYAHTLGGTVFVTRVGEIVYALPEASEGRKGSRRTLVLRETLVGRRAVRLAGEGTAATRVSYFIGRDRSGWRSGLPTWQGVSLGEAYEGIEIRLQARGHSVEKVFTVKPGARPDAIRLRIEGARSLRVTSQGELEADTVLGPVGFTRPVAFQEIGGRRTDVPVRYTLHGNGVYGFALGAYDPASPLVIDPLLASTFVGGSGSDRAYAIAIDGYDGAVFIAGWTTSKHFPGASTGVAYRSKRSGPDDAFVAKLDADLTGVLAATFLGGRSAEEAWGLAVDAAGPVYVAGFTNSHDFPTTPGAALRQYAGGRTDAFVAKLDNSLQALLASTFLGGRGEDRAQSLALGVVAQGQVLSVFATGFTRSADFPATVGPFGPIAQEDVFVSRLDPDQLDLLDSVKIGGRGNDRGQAIAVGGVDPGYLTGDPLVVVTGCAGHPGLRSLPSAHYPTTLGAYQETHSRDDRDALVTVLSWDFHRMHGSTFLGHTAPTATLGTCGRAVAIDGHNNIFVAGGTDSPVFDTTPDAYDPDYNDRYVNGDPLCSRKWHLRGRAEGWGDAFVARLARWDVSTLVASTFLGGCAADTANALVIQEPSDPSNEASGRVYVAGHTYSPDFPATDGAIHAGRADAFVARLNYSLGALAISTFLGGDRFDAAVGLALRACNVYVAGYTYSNGFPTTPGAAAVDLSGGTDAFVSKLDWNCPFIGIDF